MHVKEKNSQAQYQLHPMTTGTLEIKPRPSPFGIAKTPVTAMI